MKKKRLLLLLVLLPLLVAGIALWYCNAAVDDAAKGKLYDDVSAIPYQRVGLLLGTAKSVASGRENLYYRYRIEAAAALLQAGKIRYLVISGDNSRTDYDEPTQMRADLIAAGIDSTRIFLDYAGFRTFDSMVRLRKVFGQDSVTIISQPFHNERALYIAQREGITAVAFNARDVGSRYGFRTQLRERLARVKLFLDYLFGKEPRFLGPRVQLPV